MLKDITIGQFYPGNSLLHRLDPRTKILGLVLYMISVFIIQELWDYAYVLVISGLIIACSGVPLKVLLRGVKPLWIILVFTMILHFFMTPEGNILWQWKIFKITDAGIAKGFFMAFRLVLLINITALLTLTTTPIILTDGLESLMKVCFIPMAHELAMMMTIALRFIPTLIEETEKIMKAQIARGADFETGNLMTRAKNLIPLLIPLFLSAFRRADELAMAMEARCYRGGEGRTRMRQLKLQGSDAAAMMVMLCFVLFCIADRIWIKGF
ncbi:MAG TPA: transporter [Peptococcaceae bacterium]|nr:transporter [Peptococcaceae bacterium]